LALIKRGAHELLLEDELKQKLASGRLRCVSRRASTRPQPDLHLGHTVLLNKMRQLQELGNHALFLIGDFTGMNRRPDRQKTPPVRRCRANRCWKTPNPIATRCSMVLDPDSTEIVFNSTWMDKFSAVDLIKLAARTRGANAGARRFRQAL